MPPADPIPDDALLLGIVVGENFAALRQERRLTQDEAAQELKASGLMWGRSQVAALESRQRDEVTVSHLLLMADAFGVTPDRFVEGDGHVLLTSQVAASREWVRRRLRGDSGKGAGGLIVGARAARALTDQLGPASKVPITADSDLARRLGLPFDTVSSAAERLYSGRTLHQERDRRVAEYGDLSDGQRRVRRGHVTRELGREVERYLNEHPGARR